VKAQYYRIVLDHSNFIANGKTQILFIGFLKTFVIFRKLIKRLIVPLKLHKHIKINKYIQQTIYLKF